MTTGETAEMNSNDRLAAIVIVADQQQVKGPQAPQGYGAGPRIQEATLTGTDEGKTKSVAVSPS